MDAHRTSIFIAFVQKILLYPMIYTTEHLFLQMCHIKHQNIFHGNFQPFVFDLKQIEFGEIQTRGGACST